MEETEYRLLTYTDAARIAGVSHTTIGKWVDLGKLKPWPMPGSTRKRIRRKDLIEFLDSEEG